MSEPTITELCRAGDFVGAQRRLEAMGEECARDLGNYELCAAYADLCDVLAFYMKRRAVAVSA